MPGTFGWRLWQARLLWEARHGGEEVSDEYFAAQIGVGAGTLSPLYGAASAPQANDTILRIAKATGADPGWLAFGADSKAPAPEMPGVQEPDQEEPKPPKTRHPLEKEVTRFPVATPIIHDRQQKKGKGRKHGS